MAASIASMERNVPWCISCFARRFIRLEVDSSDSIRLPLRWSLARRSSSSVTPVFFSSRITFRVDFRTLEKFFSSAAA